MLRVKRQVLAKNQLFRSRDRARAGGKKINFLIPLSHVAAISVRDLCIAERGTLDIALDDVLIACPHAFTTTIHLATSTCNIHHIHLDGSVHSWERSRQDGDYPAISRVETS